MKHYTILDWESDADSPMVCTINSVVADKVGKKRFEMTLIDVLKEHFDSEFVYFIEDVPDIFDGAAQWDLEVMVYGVQGTIKILETWMY